VSAITKRDAIDAAMSVAEDVAESRLDPAALDQAVADECKALFGTVVGEGDSLWPLHIDVCRQALALGALTADELSEWLAVARSRAGEPLSAPEAHNDPPPALSAASSPLADDSGAADDEIDLSDDEAEADPLAANDQPEQAAPTADADADADAEAMVELPDGHRIHRRHIIGSWTR
jgi:hypothetical protein